MALSREEMIEALQEERDRLADELLGLETAAAAACSPATLAALLVPGIGQIIVATSRAACAFLSLGEIQTRIDALRTVIQSVEDMVAVVASAPDDELPTVEERVRPVVAGLEDYSAVGSIVDDAKQLAADIADDVRALGAVPGFLVSPAGLGLLALLGFVFFFRR